MRIYNKLDEIRHYAVILEYYNTKIKQLCNLILKYPNNDRYKTNLKKITEFFNDNYDTIYEQMNDWYNVFSTFSFDEFKVLELYYLHGLQIQQIAKILHYSEWGINKIKKRALTHLEEKGIDLNYDK